MFGLLNKITLSPVSKRSEVEVGDIIKYISPEHYGFRYFKVIDPNLSEVDEGSRMVEHCRDKQIEEPGLSPFGFSFETNRTSFRLISKIADQKLKRLFSVITIASLMERDQLNNLLIEMDI